MGVLRAIARAIYRLAQIVVATGLSLAAVFAIVRFADIAYAVPPPETPGYTVRGDASVAQRVVPARAPADLPTRLAAANAAAGERLAAQCTICHTTDARDANSVGPNLWNVVGRRAGSSENFPYSAAMADYGAPWTLERLDRYLTDPRAEAPGTSMVFVGIADANARADVLAYLASLTDGPDALAEAPAEPAPAATTPLEDAEAEGLFVELAEALALNAAAARASEDPHTAAVLDEASWALAALEGSDAAVEVYLQNFPDGAFASAARDKLADASPTSTDR
ncbi:MAG: c-type cytochrome [Maricaulaceae bacterium]|jgi:cytochrome c